MGVPRTGEQHIAWDQATLLRQLDLLLEYFPFPYSLPAGHAGQPWQDGRIQASCGLGSKKHKS